MCGPCCLAASHWGGGLPVPSRGGGTTHAPEGTLTQQPPCTGNAVDCGSRAKTRKMGRGRGSPCVPPGRSRRAHPCSACSAAPGLVSGAASHPTAPPQTAPPCPAPHCTASQRHAQRPLLVRHSVPVEKALGNLIIEIVKAKGLPLGEYDEPVTSFVGTPVAWPEPHLSTRPHVQGL